MLLTYKLNFWSLQLNSNLDIYLRYEKLELIIKIDKNLNKNIYKNKIKCTNILE
mgnify:CR=1 FL=1